MPSTIEKSNSAHAILGLVFFIHQRAVYIYDTCILKWKRELRNILTMLYSECEEMKCYVMFSTYLTLTFDKHYVIFEALFHVAFF